MEVLRNHHITEYDEDLSHFIKIDNFAIAEVEIQGDQLILNGISINAEMRNKGFGTILLNLVEEYAKKKNCKQIIGEISENDFDDNPKGFYMKHSYVVDNNTFSKNL